MRAGDLDRLIVIERPVTTQDPTGGPIVTWVPFARVWAQVRPLRPQERFVAHQINATVDTRFRIRYRAGITPDMRIVHDGTAYDITPPMELGRREGLEILARARVGSEEAPR